MRRPSWNGGAPGSTERRRARAAARLAACVVTLACLAPACRTVRLQPTEVSSDAVLLTVPSVRQDELYECGLASISALCAYYDVELPPAERRKLVGIAEREEGLSGEELRGSLERAGMEVFVFPGTLDHDVAGLYRHVDRGRPLLVMISVDEGEHHYCLFDGYDPRNGNVFLLDPRRGSLVLPAGSFDALWRNAGRFTLLAVPSEPAPTAPSARGERPPHEPRD